MTLEFFALAASLLASAPQWPDLSRALAPTYLPAQRAVDNWRRQGALHLDLSPERALALALGRDFKGLSRCVRLNNYWCVKKAGWTGEIAADDEGHVAFAGAAEGAAVAAQLLRRYYVDFGLHSARAIVQRWAPAQCGAPVRIAGEPGRRDGRTPDARPRAEGAHHARPRLDAARAMARAAQAGDGRAQARQDRGPAPLRRARSRPADDADARHRRRPRRDGSKEVAGAAVRLAMLPYPGTALGPDPRIGASLPPLPKFSCAPETQRIANYATNIAAGVAAGPDADLALFDAQGKPTPNFAKALFNMAAVEIGPLRATQALVDAAVARMTNQTARDATGR